MQAAEHVTVFRPGTDVGLGFGVDSSSGSNFFVTGGVSLGLAVFFFFEGVGSSSSSSGVGRFFAAGVSEGFALLVPFFFFFAGFGLPVGVEDSEGVGDATVRISSRAFRKASRFFLSASLICACSKVPNNAVSARAHPSHALKVSPRNRDETG